MELQCFLIEFYTLRQVCGANKIITGKISRRPAIIAMLSVTLEILLKPA